MAIPATTTTSATAAEYTRRAAPRTTSPTIAPRTNTGVNEASRDSVELTSPETCATTPSIPAPTSPQPPSITTVRTTR